MSSPKIKLDVLQLIKQYIETKGNNRLEYSFEITHSVTKEIDFPEVLMLVENIISNSIKAKATKLCISSKNVDGKCQIDFTDDGKGLEKKYLDNPQAIFELGETTTQGGFGIGGFHMKEIVEKIGGKITVVQARPSYVANYKIADKDFHWNVAFLDGKQYTGQVDLFVGGSPCQSFSLVGKQRGLEDTRGTLFYEYARLVKEIQPKVFIYR